MEDDLVKACEVGNEMRERGLCSCISPLVFLWSDDSMERHNFNSDLDLSFRRKQMEMKGH
jgi:hypothetical protein